MAMDELVLLAEATRQQRYHGALSSPSLRQALNGRELVQSKRVTMLDETCDVAGARVIISDVLLRFQGGHARVVVQHVVETGVEQHRVMLWMDSHPLRLAVVEEPEPPKAG